MKILDTWILFICFFADAWNSCKNGEGIETVLLCMTKLLIDQDDAKALHCTCQFIPTLCYACEHVNKLL